MEKVARDYCERLTRAEEASKAREAVAQKVFEVLVNEEVTISDSLRILELVQGMVKEAEQRIKLS